MKWVTVKKCADMLGLSEEAIRALKKKGEWREKVHWVKRNGRVFINLEKVNLWIEGRSA